MFLDFFYFLTLFHGVLPMKNVRNLSEGRPPSLVTLCNANALKHQRQPKSRRYCHPGTFVRVLESLTAFYCTHLKRILFYENDDLNFTCKQLNLNTDG